MHIKSAQLTRWGLYSALGKRKENEWRLSMDEKSNKTKFQSYEQFPT